MTTNTPYNAHLIERRDVHDALAVFRIGYDTGPHAGFEPGQFTTLGLIDPVAPPPRAGSRRRGPKMIRRAFSIASRPTDSAYLDFYVVRIDDGKFTTRLWQLKPGDPLFMDPNIKGAFTLGGVPNDKDLVLVGTGTGLGPFVSMLQTYRGTERWRRLVLIEGCRYACDLAYFDTLQAVAAEDDTVVYLPTVTREPADSTWPGLRGRVHALLQPDTFQRHAGTPLDPDRCHVLLCGNPHMIDEAGARLTALGFVTRDRDHPDGNLHFERYW